MKFRPTLYPTIATALGLVLLVTLGTWQWQQFQQKRALEREKQARSDRQTVDVSSIEAFSQTELGHRRVRLHGTLHEQTRMIFENRFRDGQPGVWLASPLELADGGFLIVNRGWIPFQAAKDSLPQGLTTPAATSDAGHDTYHATLHPIDRPVKDAFMRKQIADGEVTVWNHDTHWDSVDIAAISDAISPEIRGPAPPKHYLASLAERHSGDPHPIARRDQKVQAYLTAGRHIGYAIFWYTVAIALVGMYIASGYGVLGSFSRGERRS